MKAYPHKSCGCQSCRAGSRTKYGRAILKATERRFRHNLAVECRKVVSHHTSVDEADVVIQYTSNGYTD